MYVKVCSGSDLRFFFCLLKSFFSIEKSYLFPPLYFRNDIIFHEFDYKKFTLTVLAAIGFLGIVYLSANLIQYRIKQNYYEIQARYLAAFSEVEAVSSVWQRRESNLTDTDQPPAYFDHSNYDPPDPRIWNCNNSDSDPPAYCEISEKMQRGSP